jgi:hypothetical protein
MSWTGCKKSIFYIGVCQASETKVPPSYVCSVAFRKTMGGEIMSDNDEKVLPVLRLLLIAFFGLLLVLALQLFLLVTGAKAGITEAHRNIAPLISESLV